MPIALPVSVFLYAAFGPNLEKPTHKHALEVSVQVHRRMRKGFYVLC